MRPAAVFLTAFAARLGYWLWLGRPVAVAGDALEYSEFARNLVETGRYAGPHGEFATRLPGYPLFLAGLRLFTGGSTAAVITAQCLLGAATCVLLYRLAERLLPRPWPLVCGFIAAIYFDLIVPCAAPISESLFSFFLVLSAWALYNEDWTPRTRALAFGALAAYLYLIRPEPLPYILATIWMMPYVWAKFDRKQALSALAVFTLVVGIWVGRNFATVGVVIPASTMGQTTKYLGLFLPAERQGLAPEGRLSPPDAMGELEREAAMAAAYRALAARLTWTQIAKAYAFNFASILYPFLPAYDWSYVVLVPFFFLGLREAWRRKELRPLAGAVLCSIGIFIFFGGPVSRYRQGVSPFIVLLATAGLAAAEKAAGRARLRAWAGGWTALNLFVWLGSGHVRELALRAKDVLWRH